MIGALLVTVVPEDEGDVAGSSITIFFVTITTTGRFGFGGRGRVGFVPAWAAAPAEGRGDRPNNPKGAKKLNAPAIHAHRRICRRLALRGLAAEATTDGGTRSCA